MNQSSCSSRAMASLQTRLSVLEHLWRGPFPEKLENPIFEKYPVLAENVNRLCTLMDKCQIDVADVKEVESLGAGVDKSIIMENRTLLMLVTARAERIIEDCSPLLDSLLTLTKRLNDCNVDKEACLERFKRVMDRFNNIMLRLNLLLQRRLVLKEKIIIKLQYKQVY